MAEGELLVAGLGGLGCQWARRAHARSESLVDLVLIDADDSSIQGAHHAHALSLGDDSSDQGCACLPELAEVRMRSMMPLTERFLEPAELVLIMCGLGGGVGSGASVEFARQAAQAGCMVLSVAAMPFEAQPARRKIAEESLARLRSVSHICVELSLDRLAWQARERGVDWSQGAAWLEELSEGLMHTLAKVGLINLDLMDLRAIISKEGGSTMLVAEGHCDEADELFARARSAPLAAMEISGASGCLLQIEGGPHMTLKHVEKVAEAFTRGLSEDSQVIIGARITPELDTRMRVVAVVAGLPREIVVGLV